MPNLVVKQIILDRDNRYKFTETLLSIRLLTYNLYVALTASHWVRVHLTHVPSTIHLLSIFYMKIPRAVVIE